MRVPFYTVTDFHIVSPVRNLTELPVCGKHFSALPATMQSAGADPQRL